MKLIGVEIPERFVFRAGVTCTRAALAGRNVFRLLGVRPLPGQGGGPDGQRAGLGQPPARQKRGWASSIRRAGRQVHRQTWRSPSLREMNRRLVQAFHVTLQNRADATKRVRRRPVVMRTQDKRR
jgi:hypothetical protein